MVDPVRALLIDIESEIERLPGAVLAAPDGGGGPSGPEERFKEIFGRSPPPGFLAFMRRHDGGVLGGDVRIFSWDESVRRLREAERSAESGSLKGLWPVAERGARLFALDAEAAGEPEWPVV